MPNWASTAYAVEGDAQEIKNLYELMKNLQERKEPSVCPAAFPNQRWPFSSPTCRACRVGYSVKFPAVCLPFRPFPTVWLACKISPGKESRKASEGREKKNDV